MHLLKSSVENIFRFTTMLIFRLSKFEEQVLARQLIGFGDDSYSLPSKIIVILSHTTTGTDCEMLCWAATASQKAGLVYFDAEEDRFCPDCGNHGDIGSSVLESNAIKSRSFNIKKLPQAGRVVVIRQASGHRWSYN